MKICMTDGLFVCAAILGAGYNLFSVADFTFWALTVGISGRLNLYED